jgi:hypothetical protein
MDSKFIRKVALFVDPAEDKVGAHVHAIDQNDNTYFAREVLFSKEEFVKILDESDELITFLEQFLGLDKIDSDIILRGVFDAIRDMDLSSDLNALKADDIPLITRGCDIQQIFYVSEFQ